MGPVQILNRARLGGYEGIYVSAFTYWIYMENSRHSNPNQSFPFQHLHLQIEFTWKKVGAQIFFIGRFNGRDGDSVWTFTIWIYISNVSSQKSFFSKDQPILLAFFFYCLHSHFQFIYEMVCYKKLPNLLRQSAFTFKFWTYMINSSPKSFFFSYNTLPPPNSPSFLF